MLKRLALIALALSIAGCGGGGGGSATPSSPTGSGTGTTTTSSLQTVTFNVKIYATSTSASNARRPAFVSSATEGVLVNVYSHADTTHSTILGTSSTDVSPGSTACGGATGTRTCTVQIPAPAGNDDFVFTTYDAPPVGNSFSGANVLGTGTVNQTIIANQTNTIGVSVGGVVASISISGPIIEPSDGTSRTVVVTLVAKDASGNIIVGGSNDPYVNPITLAQPVENNGSGHIYYSGSTTITNSATPILLTYDGKGGAGYYATLSASAPATANIFATTPAVGPVTATFAGFVATTTSSYLNPGYPPTINFTGSGQTATFNVYQWQGSGYTYSVTSCPGIVTASTPSNPTTDPTLGFYETFTLTSGSTSGACNLTVSNGSITVPITANVSVSGQPSTGAQITIPSGPSASSTFILQNETSQSFGFTGVAPVTSGTLSFGTSTYVYSCCGAPATLSAVMSQVPPNGMPTLSGAGVNTVLEYGTIQLGVNTDIYLQETYPYTPVTLSFTLSSPPSGQYYLAYYNSQYPTSGWVLAANGPGTIGGNTITFTSTQAAYLYGSGYYGLALYK